MTCPYDIAFQATHAAHVFYSSRLLKQEWFPLLGPWPSTSILYLTVTEDLFVSFEQHRKKVIVDKTCQQYPLIALCAHAYRRSGNFRIGNF